MLNVSLLFELNDFSKNINLPEMDWEKYTTQIVSKVFNEDEAKRIAHIIAQTLNINKEIDVVNSRTGSGTRVIIRKIPEFSQALKIYQNTISQIDVSNLKNIDQELQAFTDYKFYNIFWKKNSNTYFTGFLERQNAEELAQEIIQDLGPEVERSINLVHDHSRGTQVIISNNSRLIKALETCQAKRKKLFSEMSAEVIMTEKLLERFCLDGSCNKNKISSLKKFHYYMHQVHLEPQDKQNYLLLGDHLLIPPNGSSKRWPYRLALITADELTEIRVKLTLLYFGTDVLL